MNVNEIKFAGNRAVETEILKIVTTSVQKEVRIWSFEFVKEKDGGGRDALAVNFIANLVGHGGVVNVARFSADGYSLNDLFEC